MVHQAEQSVAVKRWWSGQPLSWIIISLLALGGSRRMWKSGQSFVEKWYIRRTVCRCEAVVVWPAIIVDYYQSARARRFEENVEVRAVSC